MRYTPRNVTLGFNHAGLTHYGGTLFLHEFARVLQIRHFLARHLDWERRNSRYTLSQMVLALAWPLILGLDRIETASLLRCNGTFQFLTGLQSFPDPANSPSFFCSALLHRLQFSCAGSMIDCCNLLLTSPAIVLASLLIWTAPSLPVLDTKKVLRSATTRVIVENDPINPCCAWKPDPPHLWATLLRPGKTDPYSGTVELFRDCWSNLPTNVREIRVRADAGFLDNAFLTELEDRETQYALVAQIRPPLRRLLPGLKYQRVNADWEMAECEYKAHVWTECRRHVIARRLVETAEHHLTLFQLGRYYYRGWVTNMDLTPPSIWRFYDGRAAIEVRIRELREDFAFSNIATRAFAANNLYLEIIRFAYNLVTAFQRICLPDSWQSFTLRTLRHKLFLLPGSLVRPNNRPILRLHKIPKIELLAECILSEIAKLQALGGLK